MSEGVLRCPRCTGSDDLRHSRWRWFDVFSRALGLKAYRCRSCHNRFFSRKVLREASDGAQDDREG